MSKNSDQQYDIIGFCEECQNEVWGRKLADGDLVIVPCEYCRDEAFNEGYEAGYADLDMEKGGHDADSESQE